MELQGCNDSSLGPTRTQHSALAFTSASATQTWLFRAFVGILNSLPASYEHNTQAPDTSLLCVNFCFWSKLIENGIKYRWIQQLRCIFSYKLLPCCYTDQNRNTNLALHKVWLWTLIFGDDPPHFSFSLDIAFWKCKVRRKEVRVGSKATLA